MQRLFTPGVTAVDPAYNNIRDGSNETLLRGRSFAEALWERYEPYADENFCIELQNDFYARFWEMYLACSLMEVGHEIKCLKPGPDILLTVGETRIWIEAVAPSGGQTQSPDRVPDYRLNEATYTPLEKILLRIRGAISEKFDRKYHDYRRSGIVGPNDAYVIAVNASKINYALYEGPMPHVLGAVYPVGNPQVMIDRQTLKVTGSSYTYRDELKKMNGQSVLTDLFLQEPYQSLSAVSYSCVDPVNRRTRMGDDYVLVHNLHAATGAPLGLFRRGREYVASAQEEGFSLTVRNWSEENVNE